MRVAPNNMESKLEQPIHAKPGVFVSDRKADATPLLSYTLRLEPFSGKTTLEFASAPEKTVVATLEIENPNEKDDTVTFKSIPHRKGFTVSHGEILVPGYGAETVHLAWTPEGTENVVATMQVVSSTRMRFPVQLIGKVTKEADQKKKQFKSRKRVSEQLGCDTLHRNVIPSL